MFRQSSPSLILATIEDASSSVMDIFGVHPCPLLWKNEYAVRVSRCDCSVKQTARGKWTLPITTVQGCLLVTPYTEKHFRQRFV